MSFRSLLITEVTIERQVKANVDGVLSLTLETVAEGVMVVIQESVGGSGGVRSIRGSEGTEYDAILFAEAADALQPSGTTTDESLRYRVTVTGGRGHDVGKKYTVIHAGVVAGRGHHIEATLKRLPASGA